MILNYIFVFWLIGMGYVVLFKYVGEISLSIVYFLKKFF